jgi:hypothetical protein
VDLVNELQISAERDDVLTVLRKAKRVASKLARPEISEWLQHELEGYPGGKPVPLYRKIHATLAMNSNGYIPAGFGYVANGIRDMPELGLDTDVWIRESISSVVTMIGDITSSGNGVYYPLDRERDESIRRVINPYFRDQVSFLLHLNTTFVKAIPEQIKDKVLDWACALENAGVKGDGLSFDEREKKLADSITFNINDCTIEQLTNMGTNQKGS